MFRNRRGAAERLGERAQYAMLYNQAEGNKISINQQAHLNSLMERWQTLKLTTVGMALQAVNESMQGVEEQLQVDEENSLAIDKALAVFKSALGAAEITVQGDLSVILAERKAAREKVVHIY